MTLQVKDSVNHSFFLARRFLASMKDEKNIATMLRICGISIVITTAALVIIIAVMNGFHNATKSALQGIHTDIIMQAPPGGYLDFEKINTILISDFDDMIASATPFAYHYVILQAKNTHDISHVVIVQGLDLTSLSSSHRMRAMMHWYKNEPQGILPMETVMISSLLAEELELLPESPITLLGAVTSKEKERRKSAQTNISLEKSVVRSVGTFKSGIEDFDQRVIFCSLETFKELFPQVGISQIGIMVKKNQLAATVCSALKKRFNVEVFQWQALYPSLLNALELEYSALILILLLVMTIVGITLTSLLMMYLFYQQTTIILFRSMGMSLLQLRAIFTLISCVISLSATVLGTLIAIGISWLLDHYQLISLPEIYHINHIPADVPIMIVFTVIVLMNSMSFITSWWVTHRIKKMNIAIVLKQSGL